MRHDWNPADETGGTMMADPEATFTAPGNGVTAATLPPPSESLPTLSAATPTGEGPDATPAAGVPRYRLRRVIGHGGMGEVWEAEQSSLERVVAVKRIRRRGGQTASDSARRERDFRVEAMISARLEHPGIVPVHDLGVDEDGAPLMAMKLVQGKPWDDLLRADLGQLDEESFLEKHIPILRDMAQAVAFAHSRGIVHRDLKPSQVMVGEFGEVLLMDWGLAVLVREDQNGGASRGHWPLPSVASASNPAGTPSLMAPEQTLAHANQIGPHTDVYLLGGTLYFLLTGTYPHAGSTAALAFENACKAIVEPPAQRAPARRVPPRLAEICLKALARDPKDRHASAQEFLADLTEYSSGAARRRESAALLDQARRAVDEGLRTYARCTELDAQLARALVLWPGNADADALREHVLEAFAQMALDNGDLTLARAQAGRLASRAGRDVLDGRIASEEARIRGQHRQRRVALVAAALLAIVIVGLGIVLRGAAADRARQQEVTALLSEIDALREAELRVADTLAARFPVPRALGTTLYTSARLTPEEQALVDEADALLRQREQLAARVEGGIGERPVQLAMAHAMSRFHTRHSREEFEPLVQEFLGIARRYPQLPEPWLAAGVSSAMARDFEAAARHARQAAKVIESKYGQEHPDHVGALRMEASFLYELSPTSPAYIELSRRSLEAAEPALVRDLVATARMHSEVGHNSQAIEYLELARKRLESSGTLEESVHGRVLQALAYNSVELGDLSRHRLVIDQYERLYLASLPPDEAATHHAGRAHALASFGLDAESAAQMDLALAHAVDPRAAWPPSERIPFLKRAIYYLLAKRRPEQALPLATECVELSIARDGAGSLMEGRARADLASVLGQLGRWEEALVEHERAVAIYRASSPGHPDLQWMLSNHGSALSTMGRPREGVLAAYEEAFATAKAYPSTTSVYLLRVAERLAYAYHEAGEDTRAADVLLDAWARFREAPPLATRDPDGQMRSQLTGHDLPLAMACVIPGAGLVDPAKASALLEALVEAVGHPSLTLDHAQRFIAHDVAARAALDEGDKALAASLVALADALPEGGVCPPSEEWRKALNRRASLAIQLEDPSILAPALARVLRAMTRAGTLDGLRMGPLLSFVTFWNEHRDPVAQGIVRATLQEALDALPEDDHLARAHLTHCIAVLLVQDQNAEAVERFEQAERLFLAAAERPDPAAFRQFRADRTDTGTTFRLLDTLAQHSGLEIAASLDPEAGAEPGRVAKITHNWAVLSMGQTPIQSEQLLRFAVQQRLLDDSEEAAHSLFLECRTLLAASLAARRAGGTIDWDRALAAATHVDAILVGLEVLPPEEVADARGRGWLSAHAVAAWALHARGDRDGALATLRRAEALAGLSPTEPALRLVQQDLAPLAKELGVELQPVEPARPRAVRGGEARALLDEAAPRPSWGAQGVEAVDWGGEALAKDVAGAAEALSEARAKELRGVP